MAKLQITKRKDVPKEHKGISISDYDILIDGHEPSGITGITLDLDVSDVNRATLSFCIDDLVVDAEFLAAIEAKIEKDSVSKEG